MTCKKRSLDADHREQVRAALEARLDILDSLPSELAAQERERWKEIRRKNLETMLGLRARARSRKGQVASVAEVSAAAAPSPERDARVVALYAQGLTYDQIAAEVGMHRPSVDSLLHRLRMKGRLEGIARPKNQAVNRLPEEARGELEALARSGLDPREIAARTGRGLRRCADLVNALRKQGVLPGGTPRRGRPRKRMPCPDRAIAVRAGKGGVA
jgi:transposase